MCHKLPDLAQGSTMTRASTTFYNLAPPLGYRTGQPPPWEDMDARRGICGHSLQLWDAFQQDASGALCRTGYASFVTLVRLHFSHPNLSVFLLCAAPLSSIKCPVRSVSVRCCSLCWEEGTQAPPGWAEHLRAAHLQGLFTFLFLQLNCTDH